MDAKPPSPANPETVAADPSPDDAKGPPTGGARVLQIGLRLLPFPSLGLGIASAFVMDRSPAAAFIIVPAAIVGWFSILGFVVLGRVDPEGMHGKRRLVVAAGRLGSLFLMQSLMQQSYLFAIPFYVAAASRSASHIAFVSLLVVGALLTLWDPLYERVMKNAVARFILESLGTFASANAILPVLGLGNTTSLYVSALLASLGVPLQTWLASNEFARNSRALIAGVFALLVLPPLIAFPGAAFVPPAPLSVLKAEIGTRYDAKKRRLLNPRHEIVGRPAQLVCATSIGAPQGLKDRLLHVWRQNGHVVDRIPLKVRGGREQGFRTYSRKQKLGRGERYAGLWSCAVETEAGQLVGIARIRIKPGKRGGDPRGIGDRPGALEEMSAALDQILGP